MVEKDDNELVYEVIHGSISSFELLIDRYQKTIFNILFRMVHDEETAKDLTQDVFIKAFEKMGSFNFNYRFFSWIYRIACNQAINHLKSKRRFEVLNLAEMTAEDKANGKLSTEKSKKLQLSLRQLRADFRLLILLKYFFGLSYEEISEVLELSEKKVKARLYTAREQLREALIEKDFFEDEK